MSKNYERHMEHLILKEKEAQMSNSNKRTYKLDFNYNGKRQVKVVVEEGKEHTPFTSKQKSGEIEFTIHYLPAIRRIQIYDGEKFAEEFPLGGHNNERWDAYGWGNDK